MWWTVLACDGNTGLDDLFEASLLNTSFNSAFALMAAGVSAIRSVFQPLLSPAFQILFNRVILFLCCRICLHIFLPLCQAVLTLKV